MRTTALLLLASVAASPAYASGPVGDAPVRAPLRQRVVGKLKSLYAVPAKGASNAVQKAILLTNAAAASVVGGKIIEAVATSPHPVRDGVVAGTAAFLGWHAADLPMSFGHFALDNYFQDKPGPLQSTAKAFQDHHDDPSEVTRRSFAHNFAAIGKLTAPFLVWQAASMLGHPVSPGDMASTLHVAKEALALGFTGGVAMAIPSHVWAHMNPAQIKGRIVGPVVRGMQRAGFFIKTMEHSKHHYAVTNKKREPFYRDRDPHNGQYAILTGQFNKVLDNPTVNAYRRTEGLVYRTTGAIPNSWRSKKSGAEMMRQALGDERAAALEPTIDRTED
jgi:hypothetical protein